MPRPGATAEDDGWVLTLVYDAVATRTSLAILDAQRIEEGPVAWVHLPHHVPLGASVAGGCVCVQCWRRGANSEGVIGVYDQIAGAAVGGCGRPTSPRKRVDEGNQAISKGGSRARSGHVQYPGT